MASKSIIISGLLAALVFPADAQEPGFATGGDMYISAQSATIAVPVDKDAFLAGFDVRIAAPVVGDAHAVGFDIDIDERVGGDVYAAGYSVEIRSPVAGDATLAGNAINLQPDASVAGNARLGGATVTVSAPVAGAALISADVLSLNAAVTGDLSFFGRTIEFGPAAKVAGKITIHAPEPISVPARVAETARVAFERIDSPDYVAEAGRTADSVIRRVWPAFWIATAWVALLAVIGTLFIALSPKLVAGLEAEMAHRPIRRFGFGILVFAAVLGLVPLTAMTVFGILLLPFVVIFALVGGVMAYLAGAYLLGTRIAGAFTEIDANPKRLAILVSALVLAAVLGLIPLFGWLVSLTLATFGFGAIASVTFERSVSRSTTTAIHPINAGE